MIKLNGEKVIFRNFPNNEVMLENNVLDLCKEGEVPIVMFKYDNDATFMHLFLLKSFLDANSVGPVNLIISYMPYSRMDRSSEKYAFSLKYMARFVNSLNFSKVIIGEPHSDVTPALIDRSSSLDLVSPLLKKAVKETGFNPETDYIYFPDITAEKRYGKLCKAFPNQLIGMKDRDFSTGNITGLKIIGELSGDAPKVIIVDDLCSKGGTFLAGATALKEQGAGDIFLVVGHCEGTIFRGAMLESDLIVKTFTTNSIIEVQHEEKLDISDTF
jgi:ribose-phosphate pyrophosphokinase